MKITAAAFVVLGLANVLQLIDAIASPNLALRRPTWQSSLLISQTWLKPDLAVDGKTTTLWGQRSCTSSKLGKNQWWAVDLGKETNVYAVTILSRFGLAGFQSNLVIGLTNDPPNVKEPTIGNVQVCGRGPLLPPPKLAVACATGLPASRYVVLISAKAYMTMCEVEVFGQTPDFTNLALAKPTWQSSLSIGAKSAAAVDGNRNPLWNAGSCTSTGLIDPFPWWAVDLGQPSYVYVVAVTNRGDLVASTYLNGFIVGLTNSDPAIRAPALLNVKVCAKGPLIIPAGQTTAVACADNTPPARYVAILRLLTFLSMCEVEVYGTATSWINLALKKPTWQSSLSPGSMPSAAVDGNRNSMWLSHSCTSTKLIGDRNPWWAVDLGQPSNVFVVTVTNRGDCCALSQSNLIIGLTNTAPATTPPQVNNVLICGRGPAVATLGAAMPVTCDIGLPPSRYVAILSSTMLLTICEVEVFGNVAVIDPCLSKPCKNGGVCSTDENNKFTCSCVPGWTGDDCSTDTNVCAKGNPCLNGGVCVKYGNSYECQCKPTWAGRNCEMGSAACKAVDPTKRMNCGWGGVTPAQCNSRSCCFDDSVRNRPACFFSTNTCDTIPDEELADCGWDGINYNQCINRGCCFDDNEDRTGPICFRRANPACIGVPADERESRGSAGIQPNECTAQGWCYETGFDQKEGPWCFVRKA